jgi:hypothetical protein
MLVEVAQLPLLRQRPPNRLQQLVAPERRLPVGRQQLQLLIRQRLQAGAVVHALTRPRNTDSAVE